MMISQQVCSIELAKRLKELGVKQDSLFIWGAYENPLKGIVSEKTCPDDEYCIYYCEDKVYKKCPTDYSVAAYTVAELGNMLMDFCINNTSDVQLYFNHNCNGYYTLIIPTILNKILNIYIINHKESDVRAYAVIWIIENGYMQVSND